MYIADRSNNRIRKVTVPTATPSVAPTSTPSVAPTVTPSVAPSSMPTTSTPAIRYDFVTYLLSCLFTSIPSV